MKTRLAICLLLVMASPQVTFGCPFCDAQQPTLAQRRETAQIVALGEITDQRAGQVTLKLHHVAKGQDLLSDTPRLELDSRQVPGKVGSLVLLMRDSSPADGSNGGEPDTSADGEWSATPVDETSYAYFVRSPGLRTAEVERLGYFVRYLEHANRLIAEDAYLEFAHASFDAVQRAPLPARKQLQGWLVDPLVPERRRGLYGLMLGLSADDANRKSVLEFLTARVHATAIDFRGGFDGILGGYLLAGGKPALDDIEARFLANPEAAIGDVRHAQNALRFYWQHGRQIPAADLRAALRQLLARPEFARDAIIDLARWEDWQACDQVTSLYGREGYRDPSVERAIIGYLLTCPEPAALRELARLRERDPDRVAEAEQMLRVLGGVR